MTRQPAAHVDPTREAMALFRGLPADRPVAMINLLRFRDAAAYPADHAGAGAGLSGADAYARIRAAIHRAAGELA